MFLPVVAFGISVLCGVSTNSECISHSRDVTLGDRTYRLHIPSRYDRSKKHPLVLSFHGRGGDPRRQETLSQWSQDNVRIHRRSVIAAYPLGAIGANNETAWEGVPYAASGVDDISFTLKIVKDISAKYKIDPKRVYATGKSNGGGLVNLLACTKRSAAIFAAFAPISAALYAGTLALPGENCAPGRSPIPIINSHGYIDGTIPYRGRNGTKATASIQEWRQAWAARNGCSCGPNLTEPFANTTAFDWSCSVKALTIYDLGHSWPTTLGLDTSGAPDNVAAFDMTAAELIPFFNAHSLP